ncbi:MAG: hypothetical protein ACJAUG_003089 [Halioglobus sp.]|jgi:hypothetical protein
MLISPCIYADRNPTGGIHATTNKNSNTLASFDIIHAKVATHANIATFHRGVSAEAGANKPSPSGKLAGSNVFSYVWPTSLDSAIVGFEKNADILALAVTAHANFDNTPLYDENADNDTGNDGDI